MGANLLLKKLLQTMRFVSPTEGDTEHQLTVITNWIFPKNRADVCVVMVESKQ
jgi:hypothetical protein